MPIFTVTPPLGLYIHLPWCVQKCPYCDFNSHAVKDNLPEELYVTALLQELDERLYLIKGRSLISIFIGGGTPSLFSAKMIARLLAGVADRVPMDPSIEITMEANPGTIDQVRFHDFRHAGTNRLSIGIQSLQNDKLKALGRIHDKETAHRAIMIAKEAGLTNFNLDLMYGLPNQSFEDAMSDVKEALSFHPAHFSWYQLTIEPNTFFYRRPPVLPHDDTIWDMQLAGQALLSQAGFQQYEVSAYALPGKECLHNRNYWEFGDYLGIGAGAHSKLTDTESGIITRFSQVKHPKEYLALNKRQPPKFTAVSAEEACFEFMLNGLRLTQGVPSSLFELRTGLSIKKIGPSLVSAKKQGLLMEDNGRLCPTSHGKKFLNNLVEIFLP